MTLRISDTLSLPIDAATQTFAFIARKGAGKTYAAGKLAELLMTAHVQVVVLDTVGNWYGLRLGADGKGKGFDIPVIGGLRGDIPIKADAAAVLADVVVDSGRSMVLDLSQFSLADRKRFATAFGERLWQRKKGEEQPSPLHLVIEESQLIVPQFSGRGGDDARMLGIYEEIIRLGRNYGIGVSMISQRPQSVNKEVLNQTECLMVGQVNGFQEREALKKWIVHQGMDVHLIDELPSLKIGTFYIWSPQWLGILQKIKIAPKTTFDASATPKVGQNQARRQIQPLDLDDLKQKLAATIERAKADDPRELKRRIAELERELKAKPAAAAPERIEVKVPVISDAQIIELKRICEAIFDHGNQAMVAANQFGTFLETIKAVIARFEVSIEKPKQATAPRPYRAISVSQNGKGHAHPIPADYDSDGPTRPQRNILNALNEFAALGIESVSRKWVAVRAGASHKSSAYTNNLGALRSAGMIVYGSAGELQLTGKATQFLEAREPLAGDELFASCLRIVSEPQGRILKVLSEAWPAEIDRDKLGDRAGASPTSSAFTNNLGFLRSAGMIEYCADKKVRAADWLFPT